MEPKRTSLADLGWNDARALEAGELGGELTPARVVRAHGTGCVVLGEAGELEAFVAGRIQTESPDEPALPAPGDWVLVQPGAGGSRAVVRRILPRASKLSRKTAGTVTAEQVVAANIDIVFVVTGLDQDYNPRRVERMCVAVWDSGARPVVLLSKADKCVDAAERTEAMEASVPGVPVYAVSCLTGDGLERLEPYLRRGLTVALLGSSGVGKSTLVNRLVGEELLETGATREHDGRGRHTTTHRQMVALPTGAWLIDGPGVRELALWDGEEGLHYVFGDIQKLAQRCRFRDCSHGTEPGCAVKAAIGAGELQSDRLRSFVKLEREVRFQQRRQDTRARLEEKRRWKLISKRSRQMVKNGWA